MKGTKEPRFSACRFEVKEQLDYLQSTGLGQRAASRQLAQSLTEALGQYIDPEALRSQARRLGSNRPKKKAIDLETIAMSAEVRTSFEAFCGAVQSEKLSGWDKTPKSSIRALIKSLRNLL